MHKCRHFNLYNATCVHVFRKDHLVSGEPMCYSAIPWEGYLQLSAVFVVCSSLPRVEASWVSLTRFSKSVAALAQLICNEPCWRNFMGDASEIPRRHKLTENSVFLQLFQSSCHFFWNGPWHSGGGIVNVSTGTGLQKSAFWMLVIFCSGICLLQRKFPSLVRAED